MLFYTGTHVPKHCTQTDVPLFMSRRRLCTIKKLPRAKGRWACDSGGFTEIQIHGRWTLTPSQYIEELRRYWHGIGHFDWAAPQDWMCEAPVLRGLVVQRKHKTCPQCKAAKLTTLCLNERERPTFVCSCGYSTQGKPPQINVAQWRAWASQAGSSMVESVERADTFGLDAVVMFHGTGLTIEEHQRRTVANFLELRRLAPDLPIIPVLQGWTLADYLRCVRMYEEAGVDLRAEPTVGVGTVCRRQATKEASIILRTLAALGIKIHGFGFKMLGIEANHDVLFSADSLAWSYAARMDDRLPGHTGHKNCANCLEYALIWRQKLLDRLRAAEDHDENLCALLAA